jgi:hypothetical protein
VSALPNPVYRDRQPCGCPRRLERLSDMCIACQIEWEDWMLVSAIPALRAALATEAGKEEEF